MDNALGIAVVVVLVVVVVGGVVSVVVVVLLVFPNQFQLLGCLPCNLALLNPFPDPGSVAAAMGSCGCLWLPVYSKGFR